MKFKLYTTRTFEKKLKLFLKKHPEYLILFILHGEEIYLTNIGSHENVY